MRFNVDRICELAGLRAASGGLLSEAAAPAKPAAPAAKAPAMPSKPVAKPAAPAPKMEEDDMESMDEDAYEAYNMEGDAEEGYHMEGGYYYDGDGDGADLVDNAMYEIDETELMEALVGMRQQRLEESAVRDAVRDEIKRALSDKSGSWIYGSNRPTASRNGQIARGGFGFGFKR